MQEDENTTTAENPVEETTVQQSPADEQSNTQDQETSTNDDQGNTDAEKQAGSSDINDQEKIAHSKRAEKRIRDLAKRVEAPKSAPVSSNIPQQPLTGFKPKDFADVDEVDPAVLTQAQQEAYEAGINQGVEQAKSYTDQRLGQLTQEQTERQYFNKLSDDQKTIQSSYDVLNPESDNYNPSVAENVADLFDKAAGIERDPEGNIQVIKNPDVTLAGITNDAMQFYTKAVTTGKTQGAQIATQNKNAAALTPGGGSQASDDDENLSLAQLEAKYGVVE